MSVNALGWAFEQDAPTGPKFLLVALADGADAAGVTYTGQALLAERCNVTRETVSRHINALEQAGLIARVQRRRANGSRSSDYTILAPLAHDRGLMKDAPAEEFPQSVIDLAKQGEDSSCAGSSREENTPPHVTETGGPEPSVEPSGKRGDARAKKIGGKPVNDEAWSKTCAVLDAFNAATGKKLGATTADDQPSESAKRIYKPVRSFPNLTVQDFERIIRNTIASKWWGEDPASVGVVFGPKVFEDNMDRPAPKGAAATDDGDDPPRRRFTRED